MHRLAVQDANILIDLELAELFDAWFQAGIETHTTDLIEAQLRRGGHRTALGHMASGRITSRGLSAPELLEVIDLMRDVGPGPDLADCSVLWLAEKLDCPLLTGDGALRSAGAKRGVEVHGTLWVMDLLVDLKLLNGADAALRVESLLNLGRRLPESECYERMAQWRRRW